MSKESHPTSQSVHHPPAKRIEGWRRCVYTIWIFNYFRSSIHRRYVAVYSRDLKRRNLGICVRFLEPVTVLGVCAPILGVLGQT